jgi:hypothetical protein
MAYLGTKPANQVIDSTLIADGTVTPSDLSTGKPYWDTSGNLGIGTSSPNDTLEVAGANAFIRVNRTGNEPGITFRYSNSSTNRGDIAVTSGGAMYFTAGGSTERMRIDSSGRVTMPYQPAFRAKINNSNYVASTNSIMPFSVAEVNVGGHFNTSTYRFTAPINGTYMFYAVVYTRVDNSQDAYPRLKVNGTSKAYAYNAHVTGITGRQDITCTLPYMATLNAGDYVELFMQGTGYSYNGSEETCFSGYLLS